MGTGSRSGSAERTGKTSALSDKGKDLDAIRPDLAEVIERHAFGLDERRPDVVVRRKHKNQRTARRNVEDFFDPGFIEYGPLAVAAQRQRRSVEDLIKRTPADGLIAGIGTVNGDLFGHDKARCMVMAYDYSVLAGTQGYFNHKKMDRLLKLAYEQRLPLVLFAEGGGGRPGDVDAYGVMVAGLDLSTFGSFARLSGWVPVIGVVSGPCFAGNAALLGCCDVIIATGSSNIGMGGPVMIEGGGLGVFKPEDVGPISSGVNTPSPPPSTMAGPPMPSVVSAVAMITSQQPSSDALPAKQRPETMPISGTRAESWPK